MYKSLRLVSFHPLVLSITLSHLSETEDYLFKSYNVFIHNFSPYVIGQIKFFNPHTFLN